jgi:hypothetical protein
MRGGYRPGAGRPKGSRTVASDETHAQPTAKSPVAYMLEIMNDPTADPARRDRMAIAAAPYLHRKQGERGAREVKDARAASSEQGTDWDGLLN